ncbi:MAG: LysM peptidoglycan-binding domain-containing protein [Roseibacillus sp.]
MKLTLCPAIGLSLIFASCSTLDPDYAAYKKQKEAEAASGSQSPFGPSPDPYGVPGSETGSYVPYQPLPGVNNPVPPAPEPLPPLGNTPGPTPAPSAPLGAATVPHVVVKGDSLWGLARHYQTTPEAIRAANGLSGDTIQTGQTLKIPSNN